MMVVLFETTGKKCQASEKHRIRTCCAKLMKILEEGREISPVFLCCSNCRTKLRVSLEAKREKSFVETVKGSSGQGSQLGNTRPIQDGLGRYQNSKF